MECPNCGNWMIDDRDGWDCTVCEEFISYDQLSEDLTVIEGEAPPLRRKNDSHQT